MTGKLTGIVKPRENLSPAEASRLYELFVLYYDQVEREVFDLDLEEKDWVLILRDRRGAVQGFTTMKLYDEIVLGERIRAVFSGNTIIDQAFWGEQELVRTWCRFMAGLKHGSPDVPLYWYLICSGYRTYLFLPLFFRQFHPRHDGDDASFEKVLCDHFGNLKFPDEYRDGVVHVDRPRECLRPELAEPSPARLRSPHVRFFLEKNPGYRRGDELVCMAEFSLENTRRMAAQALLNASDLAC